MILSIWVSFLHIIRYRFTPGKRLSWQHLQCGNRVKFGLQEPRWTQLRLQKMICHVYLHLGMKHKGLEVSVPFALSEKLHTWNSAVFPHPGAAVWCMCLELLPTTGKSIFFCGCCCWSSVLTLLLRAKGRTELCRSWAVTQLSCSSAAGSRNLSGKEKQVLTGVLKWLQPPECPSWAQTWEKEVEWVCTSAKIPLE